MFNKSLVLVLSAFAVVAAATSAPVLAAPGSMSDVNGFGNGSVHSTKSKPLQKFAQSNSSGGCKDETGNSVPCSSGNSTQQPSSGTGDPNSVGGEVAGLAALGVIVVAVAVSNGNGHSTNHSVSLP